MTGSVTRFFTNVNFPLHKIQYRFLNLLLLHSFFKITYKILINTINQAKFVKKEQIFEFSMGFRKNNDMRIRFVK